MRLFLAVGHTEMQRYFTKDSRVEIAAVVDSTEELLEALNYIRADTLILSKHLPGSHSPMQLIEQITGTRKDIRLIYLYGEEDKYTKDFIKFLESKRIIDYYVGVNITSMDLNNVLFGNIQKNQSIIKGLIGKQTRTMWIKELDSAVIVLYSNSSNGKSHLAWNIATALGERGYKTTLINVDRGNSANLYFAIDEMYYELLDYIIAHNNHKSILDSCYKKGNVKVIAGRLGDESTIQTDDFLKLFYFARAKSDILIIDTCTGLNEITRHAISNSNIDFFLFDCDLMHFHMNKLMLEKLGNDFIGDKTIAIINNCNAASEAYKYIYKQVNKLDVGFKAILPLSSCGSLGCDLMHTGKAPYNAIKGINNSFIQDIDGILSSIKARELIRNSKTIFR